MNLVKVDNDLFQFHFYDGESDFSSNITVLINGKTAILFDTAYERHSAEVKNYLRDNEIEEFIIFISHHHEDHLDGVKCFPHSTIYALDNFMEDFQEHLQTDDFLRTYKPTKIVKNKDSLKIGKHTIKCIETPGHNICSLSYLINKKHLYVGDLIFSDKFGKPSIPYIDSNSNAEEYLTSINKIAKLNYETLLTGHGEKIINKETIKNLIEDYKFYLIKLTYNSIPVRLEDCLRRDQTNYSGLKFHSTNLQNIKRSLDVE